MRYAYVQKRTKNRYCVNSPLMCLFSRFTLFYSLQTYRYFALCRHLYILLDNKYILRLIVYEPRQMNKQLVFKITSDSYVPDRLVCASDSITKTLRHKQETKVNAIFGIFT